MLPTIGEVEVDFRDTKAGKKWLIWTNMSHQLQWLLTIPTGVTDVAAPCPSFPRSTHRTRTNPMKKRQIRQWIFPNVATQSDRTDLGRIQASFVTTKKLRRAATAPQSLIGTNSIAKKINLIFSERGWGSRPHSPYLSYRCHGNLHRSSCATFSFELSLFSVILCILMYKRNANYSTDSSVDWWQWANHLAKNGRR